MRIASISKETKEILSLFKIYMMTIRAHFPAPISILSALLLVCHHFSCVSSQTDGDVDLQHPCVRRCVEKSKPMECHYKFKVEVYYVLSLACFDCPINVTDCYRPDCVAADATDKSIVVANRKLPGPSIQVCKHDVLVVDVENDADPQTTAIHWHGIKLHNYPFMDGLSMVTQCPIQPLTSFRYRFPVPDAGTSWWHSHSTLQMTNGLFGALVVRQEADEKTYKDLYDFDLPEHVIVVNDWYNKSTVEQFTRMEFFRLEPQVQGMLVNGRGRGRTIVAPNGQEYQTPLSEFIVEPDKRYRFRLISSGVECGIQVSIEGHRLLVIATDGRPVVPTAVDALNLNSGERYDFVLAANKSVANYWMKFRGLDTCNFNGIHTYQMAILRYSGAALQEEPAETPSYNYTRAKGLILNPVSSDNMTLVGAVTMLTSTLPSDPTVLRKPNVKLTLRYDFRRINDTIYNRPAYAHDMSKDSIHVATIFPMINYIFNRMPASPLLTQYADVPPSTLCDEKSLKKQGRNCAVDFCECTHVIKLPLKAVVQVLLVDDGVFYLGSDHPIHLHGHSFRVVAMGRFRPNASDTLETAAREVARLEKLVEDDKIVQKLEGAVYKDTLIVPSGGYAVIRFYTDNPGFWFLHCHIEHHIPLGMGLIFQVGGKKDFPKVPANFPKCGNFPRHRK